MKKLKSLLTVFAVTLFIMLSLSGCSNKTKSEAENTFNLANAKTEIETANKEFMAFVAAGDSVGLANLYTQDAKFMMNGAPAFTGRENIQSIFSGIIQSGISRVDLVCLEVWGNENLITEEGEVTLYAGDNQADKGKYLVLWKKVDGHWKMFRDIFNSDLPAK